MKRNDIFWAFICVAILTTGIVLVIIGVTRDSKTHYSVCVENTYTKCVLANKSLPSLETYCKIYTEAQCKDLKL